MDILSFVLGGSKVSFDELTEEQVQMLVGPQGPEGPPGPPGESSGGVGKSVAGLELKPLITSNGYAASEGAEIFNDYSERTFDDKGNAITGNVAMGTNSHAEGMATTAIHNNTHAEGLGTIASGENAHAEGYLTKASGQNSHTEGTSTTASGNRSHAEGYTTTASATDSHAEGNRTVASGVSSHAGGMGTKANGVGQYAIGHYNKEDTTPDTSATTTNGSAFIIGNGPISSSSNAFRVTYAGSVYGLASYNSSGADYAEYFEWLDGNTEAEDRVGYFVTLDGNKIRKAEPDEYILGVVSGNPCIIGNADEDWLHRWEHDEFGRFIKEEVEGFVLDEEGNPTEEKYSGWRYKENPDYDNTQIYIERKDRSEWSAVGMTGVLAVRDDGTCQVNEYATVGAGGIATAGETYRVIERVSENVVKIVLK